MSTAETILNDHAGRKDAEGVTWFTAGDLDRLGIREGLFSVFQDVQHAFKSKRLPFVAEALNWTDRWSVRDLH